MNSSQLVVQTLSDVNAIPMSGVVNRFPWLTQTLHNIIVWLFLSSFVGYHHFYKPLEMTTKQSIQVLFHSFAVWLDSNSEPNNQIMIRITNRLLINYCDHWLKSLSFVNVFTINSMFRSWAPNISLPENY